MHRHGRACADWAGLDPTLSGAARLRKADGITRTIATSVVHRNCEDLSWSTACDQSRRSEPTESCPTEDGKVVHSAARRDDACIGQLRLVRMTWPHRLMRGAAVGPNED
jgi:hypothetical protein